MTPICIDAAELYQGDCLELLDFVPDSSIDLILCDLTYGTTQCAWDSIIPFDQLWKHYERIVKDNGAIVLFGAEPFSSHLRLSNLKLFKYDIIWDKVKGTGFLNAKKQPMRNHEIISVFYKNQCTYNPQKTYGHTLKTSERKINQQTDVYGHFKGNSYSSTERYPRSIQSFYPDNNSSSFHPTQKPIALLEWLIRTYTNIGDNVIDNCMGSGSTGIAALKLGRKFIGIEKDAKYFQVARDRIKDSLVQQNLFIA